MSASKAIAQANGRKGGRPKGSKNKTTLDKEEGRRLLREMVLANMGPMIEAQMSHAKGLKFLVARHKKSGKFERVSQAQVESILDGQNDEYVALEVWEKDPHTAAFTDLMNRALDKPTEHHEHAGEGGGPLVVSWKGAKPR